jgi:hypothetical protein
MRHFGARGERTLRQPCATAQFEQALAYVESIGHAVSLPHRRRILLKHLLTILNRVICLTTS